MDTYIVLKDVKLYARHGVDPQETTVGAIFTVNLRLKADFTRALESDKLEGTVSYADVFEVVRREMQQPSQLLEHVGGRILKRLFATFPTVESIELELIKENPPMGADCQGAGIFIRADRSTFPTGD